MPKLPQRSACALAAQVAKLQADNIELLKSLAAQDATIKQLRAELHEAQVNLRVKAFDAIWKQSPEQCVTIKIMHTHD